MENITRQIILEHLDDSKNVNLKAMSKDIGCSNTNLWYYVNERRKFPAMNWLKILKALGAVKFGENSIIIKTSLAKNVKETLEHIKPNGYYRD